MADAAPEIPAPEAGDGRVLEEGTREVSGTNASLAACIADGSVPKPKLLDWQDWLKWRKGPGMRPRRDRGDPDTTALKQESVLWRSTMQRLYGEDWRALLEEQQAEEAEEDEEADAESVTGGVRSAGASVVSASAAPAASAGATATPQRLRQTLLEEFDAAAETASEHRQRMDLVMEQLESLGDPVLPMERLKVSLRRDYCEQIAGRALAEQKNHLKRAFESVLMNEEN